MEMPIPCFVQDKVYQNIEFKKPTPGIIADTKKLAEENQYYQAMHHFIAACTTGISEAGGELVTDRTRIKQIVSEMPYRTADYLCVQIMLLYHPEDGIEGVYPCPRCNKDNMAEVDDRRGIDTRDHIHDLEIRMMGKKLESDFQVKLSESVKLKIKNSGNEEEDYEHITDFTMRWPTLSDCIKASMRVGTRDNVRLQFNIFGEAITKMNGTEVDAKIRQRFGAFIFENLPDASDMTAVNEQIKRFGMDTEVPKNCIHCGKGWRATVNTANFFASGLLPVS